MVHAFAGYFVVAKEDGIFVVVSPEAIVGDPSALKVIAHVVGGLSESWAIFTSNMKKWKHFFSGVMVLYNHWGD
jgi:hypothetical protein